MDPPYTVAHENNGLYSIISKYFHGMIKSDADLLKFISASNAYFILTNAAHVSIAELFNGLGNLHVVQRPSTIGGKGAKRTKVNEYVLQM